MAEPKFRRRSVVRSKTGCASCRTRRKKCDEVKPICSRCRKDRFACHYEPPKPRSSKKNSNATASRRVSTPVSICSASSPGSRILAKSSAEPLTDSSRSSVELDHDEDDLQLLVAPSSPWSFKDDHLYIQYYLNFLAPMYATTTRWQCFYYSIVPQLAWQHPSVHHAIVVLAATFEACSTGMDTRTLVLSRTNQAIRSLTGSSTSTDVTLAVCRLLGSADQCSGDFHGSILHMGAAKRIVLDAIARKQPESEVGKIMSSSLIALTPAEERDQDLLSGFSSEAWHVIANLKTIRLAYSQFLRTIRGSPWLYIRPEIRELVLVGWSTINLILNAMLAPDVCTIGNSDPIFPASEVRNDLETLYKLQNSDELLVTSRENMQDCIEYLCSTRFANMSIFAPVIQQYKTCVENFVVIAAEMQPRMKAGTYWHDESHTACAEHQQVLFPQLLKNLGCGEGLENSVQSTVGTGVHYVCPFLSGFGPAFLR